MPPTPPSKNDEMPSTASAKDGEQDIRASEDLAAPVVLAPDAVAKVLKENTPRASADLAAESTTDTPTALGQEAPASTATHGPAEAGENGDFRRSSDEANAKAENTLESDKKDEAVAEAQPKQSSEDAVQPRTSVDVGTVTTAALPEASTPTKATSRAQGVFSAAESSPVRSGASTPAT